MFCHNTYLKIDNILNQIQSKYKQYKCRINFKDNDHFSDKHRIKGTYLLDLLYCHHRMNCEIDVSFNTYYD